MTLTFEWLASFAFEKGQKSTTTDPLGDGGALSWLRERDCCHSVRRRAVLNQARGRPTWSYGASSKYPLRQSTDVSRLSLTTVRTSRLNAAHNIQALLRTKKIIFFYARSFNSFIIVCSFEQPYYTYMLHVMPDD